jgi:hypothetical protein
VSRMIDLIRVSALPSNLMQSASRGALRVPPDEMLEILVHLATKNPIFGQQAKMTLASWDEESSRVAAANPKTSKEVLEYLINPHNLRPALLPALLENPSVREGLLVDLMATSSKEIIDAMMKSPRINRSPRLLEELKKNPHIVGHKAEHIEKKIAAMPVLDTDDSEPAPGEVILTAEDGQVTGVAVDDEVEVDVTSDVDDAEVSTYLTEHSAEIEAEGNKPFHAIGGVYDEIDSEEPAGEAAAEPTPKPATETTPKAAIPAAPKPHLSKKPHVAEDEKRGSVLQKIAKLDVKGRIQLAMKGTKEERSILIRDGTKLVAVAVLESPKITDGEVEKFAAQKNVLEAVLRAIPMKRRFAKLYPVVRNLVFNPRTPLDLSLGLMKHLLVQDLKHLSGNKEVAETVRKLALKTFKTKVENKK